MACGSSSSAVKKAPLARSCEQLISKSRLVIDDIAVKYIGEKASSENLEDMIEACNDPDNRGRADTIIACVDAAPDQPTIRACWMKDLAPDIDEAATEEAPKVESSGEAAGG